MPWLKKVKPKELIIEDVRDWNNDKWEYRMSRDNMHLNVNCDCGANLYIEPGSYEDDRFRMIYEGKDSMDNIYIFRCPVCGKETPIKAAYIGIFQFTE